ncbi:coiled-coil domain-containing protein [Kineococcus esterisolvens]|uniref:hypothetical protein n=1 Tax=unclassified Kineococcus TaxID=2621656 RepID=UPI003D7E311D
MTLTDDRTTPGSDPTAPPTTGATPGAGPDATAEAAPEAAAEATAEAGGQRAAHPLDEDLLQLAGDVSALAAGETQEHRAGTLRALERALREQDDLGRWADCDLFAVLDVDGPRPPVQERRSLLRSGALRTVLVFAPVMVTWAGLLFAGRAYGQMTAAGDAVEGLSFLQLWLDGFGGRTFFSLDRVAELAVALITAAIAVSVATDRRHRADDEAGVAADAARRHALRALASRTTLALAPHRSNAAEQLGAHFERGLTELGRLVAETIRLHADTSTLVGHVRSASSTAIEAANAASTGGEQVAVAATRLEAAVAEAMGTHAEQIAADRAQHTATLRESTDRLERSLGQLEKASADALRESFESRDRVLGAVEGVSTSVTLLSTETRAAMADLAASARDMSKHSADFGEQVTGHLQSLSTTARESVEKISTASAEVTTELTRTAAAHVERLQSTVLESIEKVTAVTGDAFSEHVASSAAQAARTMETLRADVQRTSEAAEHALGAAVRGLDDAAGEQQRRLRHDERMAALLEAQNAVLDTWRGVEARLEAAARDMRGVPSWLEAVQHEHADATGRALASLGAALEDAVSANVRETLAMAQDDHVRQVNRAYRDASRMMQEELTSSVGALLEAVPQQAASQAAQRAAREAAREAASHAAHEAAQQAVQHAVAQVERQVERQVEKHVEKHVEKQVGKQAERTAERASRAVRPPVRPAAPPVAAPAPQPVATRGPAGRVTAGRVAAAAPSVPPVTGLTPVPAAQRRVAERYAAIGYPSDGYPSEQRYAAGTRPARAAERVQPVRGEGSEPQEEFVAAPARTLPSAARRYQGTSS